VVLREELLQAGFGEPEVDRALDWLEELAATETQPFASKPADRSIRLYSVREHARLDTQCRGYLVYLEQIGILSAVQRELVLDRLMALDTLDIDVDQVKWVVLMVLFSQPGQESAFARMEDLVFEEDTGVFH
jgi:Smg protein